MADEADTTTETQTTETTPTPAPDASATDGTSTETETETSLIGDASSEGADTGSEAAGEADGEGDAPAVPDAYELTAPEGFTIDTEVLADATPVFKELGLTNEQADKLMPVAVKLAERIQTQGQQAIMAEVVAQRKAWAEETMADPDIGGAKWKETEALSAKALDALGYAKGSPFRSFLTDSGLGNHPEMIRAMRKIGELVSEDGDFVRADAGAPIKQSREQILYPNDAKEGAN